jgi:predicted MPP superfamily phosphohydrolase
VLEIVLSLAFFGLAAPGGVVAPGAHDRPAAPYRHRDTELYVSRGCGYWGPPVRLLAPLEITRVILRSA